jgi:transcriptional regulator with XRE-family HTH domain
LLSEILVADNIIRQRREAAGLTQRVLANRVGTSQQQIQRIESGVQPARLELALAIAKALNAPLAEIFPKLRQSSITDRRPRRKSKKPPAWAPRDLLDAGIDPDPRHWTIKCGLRDGKTILYRVSSREKERISEILWRGDFRFVVFDTQDKRVAIRCDGINFCQFLFDLNLVADDESEEHFSLDAYFLDGGTTTFNVEPDTVEMSKDDDGFCSQLQRIFMLLESDSDDDGVILFDDEDGERVYIRRKQLLRLELPLRCCEPALWDNSVESFDESASQNEGKESTPKHGPEEPQS